MIKCIKNLCDRFIDYLVSPDFAITIGKGLNRHGIYNHHIDLANLRKILVIRLDEIGDVVLSTPFFRELRRNIPKAHITLIVKPAVFNLVELCPHVDEILTFDWEIRGRYGQLKRRLRTFFFALIYLSRKNFDLAIIPRFDADFYDATFLAYFSRARYRIAYTEKATEKKTIINARYDQLFTHILSGKDIKHEVERNLDMLKFMGGQTQSDHLEMWLGKEDERFAEELLNAGSYSTSSSFIAIAPGARTESRRWPIQNFLDLIEWLIRERYCSKALIIGGPEEEDLGIIIEDSLGSSVINAVGKTTLRQAAALIKRCRLFIGNDTGTMHIAAAVGTPVIEISGFMPNDALDKANSPSRFGPWGVPHRIVQPRPEVSRAMVYPH